jgi:hypothetical protein
MRKQAGQILPFCLLLTTALLVLIISNFEIGFLNLSKIQEQKKLDGVAFQYATDYARGLNGLAALNRGLEIVSQRGKLVAGVYAILAGCTLFTGACSKPFNRLSSEIGPFFRKLNKLGADLKFQQEKIIHWMVANRCQTNPFNGMIFQNFHLYPSFGCEFYGDYSNLPFYRPISSIFDQKLPFVFDVPAPLKFKSEFLSEKNKMIFISANPKDNRLDKIHPGTFKGLPKKIWSLSEIKVDGEDFQKMEFKPRLNAVSLETQLWQAFQPQKILEDWPNLQGIQNEIAH